MTDIGESHVALRHRDGRETWLPSHYAREGHLDHGYAITAHRAQGATVDETFVLGSEDSCRKWGYTAFSRHRDSARCYVTAQRLFLNDPKLDPEQVKEIVTRTFSDSRAQQLALDAYRRDPRITRTIEDLDEAQQRAIELNDRHEDIPWYRRNERGQLRDGADRAADQTDQWTQRSDELADKLQQRLADPPPRRPASDPCAAFDHGPPSPELNRLHDLHDLHNHMDLGPDLGP